MRQQETIEQRVKRVVEEQLGINPEEIQNDSTLVNDLGADSLDLVELVMAIEDEFWIHINDEEAEKATTVQSIIDYIEQRPEIIAKGQQ